MHFLNCCCKIIPVHVIGKTEFWIEKVLERYSRFDRYQTGSIIVHFGGVRKLQIRIRRKKLS